MIVIIALIILIAGIRYSGKDKYFENNFSLSQTRALKGLCAVYVVFHHLCTYMADYFPSFYAFKYLGFLMVGGFFMISGYGLMYGAINKPDYLNGFFKKRILSILVPYYIINIFYLLANRISGALTKTYVIKSLFGFNLWYVSAILILYIGFYLCFRLFGKNRGMIAISIYTILYMSVMYILYTFCGFTSLGYWWYNSVICFVIGIWYCFTKNRADALLKRHYYSALIISFALMAVTYYYTSLHFNESIPLLLTAEIVCSACFAVFILLLSMKFQIGNPVLNICGDLSLEIYLSHALFIFALRSGINAFGITFNVENNYLYLILIIVCSFIFSYAVHLLSKTVLKHIKR